MIILWRMTMTLTYDSNGVSNLELTEWERQMKNLQPRDYPKVCVNLQTDVR